MDILVFLHWQNCALFEYKKSIPQRLPKKRLTLFDSALCILLAVFKDLSRGYKERGLTAFVMLLTYLPYTRALTKTTGTTPIITSVNCHDIMNKYIMPPITVALHRSLKTQSRLSFNKNKQ